MAKAPKATQTTQGCCSLGDNAVRFFLNIGSRQSPSIPPKGAQSILYCRPGPADTSVLDGLERIEPSMRGPDDILIQLDIKAPV